MLSPYISQISLLSLLWAQHMGENEAIQPEECIEGSIDSSLISPNKEQIRLSHYLCLMHASKICVRGLSLVLGPYSLWSILTMLLIFFIFCMEISRLSNIGLVSVSCDSVPSNRKLTNIAFSDMNPFPMKLLRNRRALHLERLQGELRELEAQQREFVTESAQRKDLDTILVSEDDEEL